MKLSQRIIRTLCTEVNHHKSFTIGKKDIDVYADLTGDKNPIHIEESVVHGTHLLGLVSSVVAQNYPRSKLVDLQAKFASPCLANTSVEVEVSMPSKTRKLTSALFSIKDAGTKTILVSGQVKILL